MLSQTEDRFGMSKVPDSWFNQAKKLEQEIAHENLIIIVYPAYKGSWRIGYNWQGSFRVDVRMPMFENTNPPVFEKKAVYSRYFISKTIITDLMGEKVYCYKELIPKIQKWLNTVYEKCAPVREASYLVALYRKSGLIPSHIAKKHSQTIKQRYSVVDEYGRSSVDYSQKEVRQTIRFLGTNYIRLYSKCPKCEGKGFVETILGWQCNHCDYYVCDIGNQFEFVEVK